MENKISKKIFYTIVCVLLGLWACDRTEPPVSGEGRTVLIYMAADNNLSGDGYDNIEQLLKGIGDFSGHLVVYFDAGNANPVLLEIMNKNEQAIKRVVREYDEENSASPEVLSRVIRDTKNLFPADSYGLILWSHGLGWVPETFKFSRVFPFRLEGNKLPRTKYFAEDTHLGDKQSGKAYMDIKDLREALPDNGFEFILFDACLMSGIEVMYELREKAHYIIASPAEILAEGFPYDRILHYLSGGEEGLIRVCEEYVQYYNQSINPYATITMVRTMELEALARIASSILSGRREEVAKLEEGEVWRYPNIQNIPLIYYDLGEYIERISTAEQYNAFIQQLDKVVVCKYATAYFWRAPIPNDKFSGISSYIPLSKWRNMDEYYFALEWSKIVY